MASILAVVAMLAIPLGVPAQDQPLAGDEILAVVDRQIVTVRDVDWFVFERRLENPELFSVPEELLRQRLLPEVVDELLLAFWAELEIESTPPEAIEARFQSAMRHYAQLARGEQRLRDLLEEEELDLQEFRLWTKERARRHHIIRQAMGKTAGVANWGPTDDDPAKALRYRLGHILLKPAGKTPEADEAALTRALQVRRDIAGGVPFDKAARLFSDDQATKQDGGDLGWLDVASIHPDLLAAARALSPGATSAPVRTAAGYHVLTLIDFDSPSRLAFLRRMRDAERSRLRILRGKHEVRTAVGFELPPVPAPEPEKEVDPPDTWDEVEKEVELGRAGTEDGA